MPQSTALNAWAERGLRLVVLPTGTQVKVRLPPMDSLIRRGIIPPELRAMALKFATAGVDLEKLTDDELEQFLQFKNRLVAECVKYVANEPAGTPPDQVTWEAVTLRAEDLEEFQLDDSDLTAINAVAMRQATPEAVSADALATLGLTQEAQAARDAVTPGQAVPDYAAFRGEPGGPGDRVPGEDVGDAALATPGHRRSGRRVRG